MNAIRDLLVSIYLDGCSGNMKVCRTFRAKVIKGQVILIISSSVIFFRSLLSEVREGAFHPA